MNLLKIATPYYYNLFIGIISIILGIFVILNNQKNINARMFFLLALFSGLTTIFISSLDLFGFHFNYVEHLFVLLYPLMGAFVPTLLLLFTFLFPERPKWLKFSIVILLCLPIFYFMYLAVTNKYFYDIYVQNRKIMIERTPYYMIYCLHSFIIYICFLVISFLKLRHTQNKIHQNQLRTIFLGGLIGGGVIVLGMFLTYFKICIYGYETGILIYIFFTCYAITRYQAFDIRTAFQYSLFWGISTLILFFPIISFPLFFRHSIFEYSHKTILLILWGCISILYYLFLSKYILPWINKFSFRSKSKLMDEAQILIKRINKILTISDLQKVVQRSIQSNLYPQDSLVLILNEKNYFVGRFNNCGEKFELDIKELIWLQDFDSLLNEQLIKDLNGQAIFFQTNSIILISTLIFETCLPVKM